MDYTAVALGNVSRPDARDQTQSGPDVSMSIQARPLPLVGGGSPLCSIIDLSALCEVGSVPTRDAVDA